MLWGASWEGGAWLDALACGSGGMLEELAGGTVEVLAASFVSVDANGGFAVVVFWLVRVLRWMTVFLGFDFASGSVVGSRLVVGIFAVVC